MYITYLNVNIFQGTIHDVKDLYELDVAQTMAMQNTSEYDVKGQHPKINFVIYITFKGYSDNSM